MGLYIVTAMLNFINYVIIEFISAKIPSQNHHHLEKFSTDN